MAVCAVALPAQDPAPIDPAGPALPSGQGSSPQQPTQAAPAADLSDLSLEDLSLEDLMDIQVTTMSRREERLAEVAGSVFVITRDDIEHSGLTSIPELLRLAPGVQVQRISAGNWAVSVRGGASRFANRLLVLMDGRSVYTPLFAGVFWDQQELLLEDIERIEVIRGPGGAKWGANAVNGVVNIITRRAGQTQGGLVRTSVGSFERSVTGARYGFQAGERTDGRVSVLYRNQGSTVNPDGSDVGDRVETGMVDVRFDGELEDGQSWTMRGGLATSEQDNFESIPLFAAPFMSMQLEPTRFTAGHVLGRWSRESDAGSSTSVQVYYDGYDREISNAASVIRHSLDLDMQHSLTVGGSHRLTFGGGYRLTTDSVDTAPFITARDAERTLDLLSGFVLDEWRAADGLTVSGGVKLEHNDFTGLEIQPEARLSWEVAEDTLLWASAARAVRTPTRVEDDLFVGVQSSNSGVGGQALFSELQPNRDLAAEVLWAYELGARGSIGGELLYDLSLFFNDYDEVVGWIPGTPAADGTPVPNITVPLRTRNAIESRSYGGELTFTWQPRDHLRFTAGYSFLEEDIRRQATADTLGFTGNGTTPRHQGILRAHWEPSERWSVDLNTWFNDRTQTDPAVDAFVRMDLRIGWRPSPTTMISLVGQNLLDTRHPEAASDILMSPTEIPRAVLLTFTTTF